MFKMLSCGIIIFFASFKLNAVPPPYPAATSNQQLVATQVESITSPNAHEIAFMNQLASLSEESTQLVLKQLAGTPYTSLFASTEITSRQFLRRLYDPLRLQVANPCAFQDEVYDICTAEGIVAWAEASGGRGFLNGNDNAGGFKMSGYDLCGGAQKRLSPVWTLGFGGCYSINHLHYNTIGGSSKSNTLLGAVYTLYRPAHFYILGEVIFGYANNDMHRSIFLWPEKKEKAIVKSRPNVSIVSSYAEIGVDWNCNCLLIQPFIGFEASRFKRNCKFDHHPLSYLNLIYSKKDVTQAYSVLGMHLTIPENCYDLSFAFDAAWQYRLTSSRNDLLVRFADYGVPFKITGIPDERNSMSLAMTVWSEIFEGWTVYLQTSGERWKRMSSYAFTGGLIFKW